MTRCVGKAWEQFCTTRQEVVVKSFRKLGLSLPIDGSCDEELSIKGLDAEVLRSGLKEWMTRGCHQEQDEYSESDDDSDEDLAHLMEGLNCDTGSSDESDLEAEPNDGGHSQARSDPITGNDSSGSAIMINDSSASGSADGTAPARGNARGRGRGRGRGRPAVRAGGQATGKFKILVHCDSRAPANA
jgi:hypothetical protein